MDEKNLKNDDWFETDEIEPEDFEEEDDDEGSEVKETNDGTDETEKSKTTKSDDEDTSDDKDDDDEEEEEEEEAEEEEEISEAEKNAKFAEKRRAKEAREREAREAQIKKEAKLEAELGLIKENPYTEEPINDAEDLEVYKIMKQIDEEGGDPINDFPKRMAKINREKAAAEKAAAEKADADAKKIKQETADLRKAYPELNMKELGNDTEFLDLYEEKNGRWTMIECYEYLMSKRAKEKVAKEVQEEEEKVEKGVKKITKTPSSNSNGGKKGSSNYLEMTDEEYLNLQKNNGDFF